jgi:hypothetical protein
MVQPLRGCEVEGLSHPHRAALLCCGVTVGLTYLYALRAKAAPRRAIRVWAQWIAPLLGLRRWAIRVWAQWIAPLLGLRCWGRPGVGAMDSAPTGAAPGGGCRGANFCARIRRDTSARQIRVGHPGVGAMDSAPTGVARGGRPGVGAAPFPLGEGRGEAPRGGAAPFPLGEGRGEAPRGALLPSL